MQRTHKLLLIRHGCPSGGDWIDVLSPPEVASGLDLVAELDC
jgi:hypothetical protein